MTLPRFYPVLDTGALARRDADLLATAEELLEAGARILQLRHKEYFSRELFHTAETLAGLCREAGALFVVNDRADYARLLDAALHVGQDDLPPGDARAIVGGSSVIGFSTHNEGQLRAAAAEPVDYLALGPIFATANKLNPDPVVGVDELRRLRPLSLLPLVAIGGITMENAAEVWSSGANSVAIVGGLFSAEGRLLAREWTRLVECCYDTNQ